MDPLLALLIADIAVWTVLLIVTINDARTARKARQARIDRRLNVCGWLDQTGGTRDRS